MTYLKLRLSYRLSDFRRWVALTLVVGLVAALITFWLNGRPVTYRLMIIDKDKTKASEALCQRLANQPMIKVTQAESLSVAMPELLDKRTQMIAVIRPGLADHLAKDLYEDCLNVYYDETDSSLAWLKDTLSLMVIRQWLSQGVLENQGRMKNQLVHDEQAPAFLSLRITTRDQPITINQPVVVNQSTIALAVVFLILLTSLLWQSALVDWQERQTCLHRRLAVQQLGRAYRVEKKLYQLLTGGLMLLILWLIDGLLFGFDGGRVSLNQMMGLVMAGLIYGVAFNLVAMLFRQWITDRRRYALALQSVLLVWGVLALWPSTNIWGYLSPIKWYFQFF